MSSTTVTRVDDLVSKVVQLPPIPRVAGRVLELLDAPEVTSQDLKQVIESDPALTASVLRLANSAMFGFPSRISTLTHAITLMGFLRLRSLTLATVLASIKTRVPAHAAARRDQIWEHSVNVGLGARVLAEQLSIPWSEEAFTAGLLHDCGRLVLMTHKTGAYMAIMEGDVLPAPEVEQKHLGMDHQQVGAALMRAWQLSPVLVATCERHHSDTIDQEPYADLLALVALAERFFDGADGELVEPSARVRGIAETDIKELAQAVRLKVLDIRGDLLAL